MASEKASTDVSNRIKHHPSMKELLLNTLALKTFLILSFIILIVEFSSNDIFSSYQSNLTHSLALCWGKHPRVGFTDCTTFGGKSRIIESKYHVGKDGSCKSKSEQHCFWKQSKYNPSTEFLGAIRQYESMHRGCTVGKNLSQILFQNETDSGCKYLVWVPHDGLGNRIISLASAFVYSLLTNRTLLVSQDSHFEDLFCEPFANSSWHLPQSFPLQNLRETSQLHTTFYSRMERLAKQNSASFNWSNVQAKDFPHTIGAYVSYTSHISTQQDFRFFCPKEQDLMENITWVYFDSTEFIAPAYYYIPRFRKSLNLLFPDRALFLHTARYLFSPGDEAWDQIKDFYNANFLEADARLGIQIRAWPWSSRYHPIISTHVLACATEMGLLPNVITEYPNENKSSDFNPKAGSMAVLVTSLLPEYHRNLSDSYLKYPNAAGKRVIVHTASSESRQQTGNKDHDIKAVVDMWLLSFMDDMIATPKSTFGFVAHGLSGIIPVVLRNFGMHEEIVPNPPCFRTNLAGPCFLYPPREVRCPLNPGEGGAGEPNTQVPEIRDCLLDWGIGIYEG